MKGLLCGDGQCVTVLVVTQICTLGDVYLHTQKQMNAQQTHTNIDR